MDDPTSTRADARVDVVVVAYRTPELAVGCVRSIREHAPAARLVVVDNSPDEATAEALAAEQVDVLRRPDNPGYAAGASWGIAHLDRSPSRPYVLVLNADTRLTAAALDRLVDRLDSCPQAALVGPGLTGADGSVQPSVGRPPSPWRTLLHQSGAWRLLSRLAGPAFTPFSAPSEPCAVPWVLGAVLLVRRADLARVGGFDERFTLYFEEVDLCRRLTDAGREIHVVPDATVLHVGGASTIAGPVAAERRMYAGLALYLRTHGPDRGLARLRVVVALVAAAHLVRATLTPRSAADRGWGAVLADAVRGWAG